MANHIIEDDTIAECRVNTGIAFETRRVRAGLAGLVALALVVGAAPPLNAGEPLSMTVSSALASAPATVRVRMIIEPNSRNRALEVVADSADFYRSSLIELDGERAPQTVVVDYRGLPGGNYVISGTLSDDTGRARAFVSREIFVVPSRVD
jgi:hypothetical protein